MGGTSRPAITIVGHVCIDHNLVDDTYHESWGSAILYIADYLRRVHDMQPKLLAPYGQDLKKFVDTSAFIDPPSLEHTLIYKNTIVDGVRTQAVLHSDTAVPVELTESIRKVLAETDILVLAPLLSNYSSAYIRQLCELLPPHAQKILLPQGYYREVSNNGTIKQRGFTEADDILPFIDVLIQSDEDSTDALAAARLWVGAHHNLTAIVTQNSHGATVFTHTDTFSAPTKPVAPHEIINAVGAGDVFSAELALSLHDRRQLPSALTKAQRAAYRHITGN